jgi:anti-anti-sigma factor
MPPFQVTHEQIPGTSARVIRCRGELDAHTFEILDEQLQDILDEDVNKLIVDLSEVPYVSSAGIGVLVGANSEAEDRDGLMVIQGPAPGVLQVFKDMGFDSLFTIVANQQEAYSTLGIAAPPPSSSPDTRVARRKSFD